MLLSPSFYSLIYLRSLKVKMVIDVGRDDTKLALEGRFFIFDCIVLGL